MAAPLFDSVHFKLLSLKHMQNINKSFGGMIDPCVSYFCEFVQNFLSTARAFSKVVSFLSLTTFIHCVFSFLSIKIYYTNVHFKFSNGCHLKTVQDINKSFGRMIGLCVSYFGEFFQNVLSNIWAFFKILPIQWFHKIH